VEHLVRQAAHLGVPAIAGVLAQNIGKGGYLLDDSLDDALDSTAARVAA
jgi:hypothetical protein